MRALLFSLLLLGCGAATAPEDQLAGYDVTAFREQYPDEPPGCVTVWTKSDCRLLAAGTLTDCASGEDVLIARPLAAFCELAMNHGCDCSHRELEPWP